MKTSPMVRIAIVLTLAGCASASGGDSSGDVSSVDGGGSSSSSGGSSSGAFGPGADGGSSSGDGGAVTTSTIYANTDDTLYTLDPGTNAITKIGKLSGADSNVTDCAVNDAGEVFVNTVDTIYRATLPSGGSGTVQLQKVSRITASRGQRYFALAFVPAGVLGASETLVGGDDVGELWSIDPATGATTDLGSFGPAKSDVLALSGDLVFYTDGSGKPTGLATIRSCRPGGSSCTPDDDYLAGVDIGALKTAFTSGTPAASLLAGVYGGSSTSLGPGTGHGELFGLGAWEGKVFAFERASANGGTPALVSIDTSTGAGTILGGAAAGLTFTNGWSGACVTTKVTVTVPPPPQGPR